MSCKIHWECEDEPCPYCEIDRLNKCLFQAQNAAIDLERQLDASQALLSEARGTEVCYNETISDLRELLAEARAEVERLRSQPQGYYDNTRDIAQARQEAAR